MEIKWVFNAKNSLEDTLNYWDNRNGTPSYSNKIIAELKKLLSKISNDPYSERYEKDFDILCSKGGRKYNRNTIFQKFISTAFSRLFKREKQLILSVQSA